MMLYTANQPLLFPHIYMMNRYANVEHYVSMNEAQFTKFGHQSRVELLDKYGKEVMLIVPLKNRSFKEIREVEVVDVPKTIKNIANTLQALYGSREAYKLLRDSLRSTLDTVLKVYTYNDNTLKLAELNSLLLSWLFQQAGINLWAHDSDIILPKRPEDPSEWVAEMGRAINCTTYIGGKVAQDAYINKKHFDDRGMTFVAQSYKMKPYKRFKGEESSRATVSCLDPLFYGGPALLQDLIHVKAY